VTLEKRKISRFNGFSAPEKPVKTGLVFWPSNTPG
jgi:hypothetical protein